MFEDSVGVIRQVGEIGIAGNFAKKVTEWKTPESSCARFRICSPRPALHRAQFLLNSQIVGSSMHGFRKMPLSSAQIALPGRHFT